MIDIVLSYPQIRFCKQLIEDLGAKLHGFTLSFEHLDETEHFLRKLYGLRTKTTRDYVTLTAIEKKLGAAIKKQQTGLKLKSAEVRIKKVEGGFEITRRPCQTCGEPPFGDVYCCDCVNRSLRP